MLRKFLLDQSGIMVAEYALILAILSGGLACGAYFLADAISDAMMRAGNKISAEWELVLSDKSLP